MRHVFIIGSKGIPAAYGGFETFVEKLTAYRKSGDIRYHVACLRTDRASLAPYEHNGAECFPIYVPAIGPAKAVYCDIKAVQNVISYLRKNRIRGSVLYILACRIGPFMGYFMRRLRELDCRVIVNPDGHEWKRAKWNAFIRRYWKYSERLMVKHCDLLVCDSKSIEAYIQREYQRYHPKTCFIAYGAEELTAASAETDEKLTRWFKTYGLQRDKYYLIVGRFVPENNYETVIREFMRSDTEKRLAIISNAEHNKYFDGLRERTHFESDERIVFAGTVYDGSLLQAIRKNAFGYIHGHEVGGTNPSLLEALAATDLNLLLDVSFNREVGGEAALYWEKREGSLKALLKRLDGLEEAERRRLGEKAKERMKERYSWEDITDQYERVFARRKR